MQKEPLRRTKWLLNLIEIAKGIETHSADAAVHAFGVIGIEDGLAA